MKSGTMNLKLAALALTIGFASSLTYAVTRGDSAPAWQALSFHNEHVNFPAVAQDRPTVLVFWATWCSYCKAFMPYLKDIQTEYGADRVVILAVNVKERGGDPDAYVKNLDFPVTAIRDGDPIADAYGVEFIPGLMVVDGAGTVSYRRGWTDLPAGQTVAQQWAEEVRAALDQAL